MSPQRIWVDADACPRVVKEILCRAAERVGIETVFVANRHVQLPRSQYLRSMQVRQGFDVADHRIVEEMAAGDLVITADVPLAAEVVAKGGEALGPRGDTYDEETIQERIATRNLLAQLRDEGLQTGGPSEFGLAERQAFAAALDRWLTRLSRRDG